MIVNLEVSKIIVLSRGINNGLKKLIFLGGQFKPSSIEGDSELWRKFQKKEINKNISEIINKIILNLIKFIIKKLCLPWNVLSRIISRHHNIEIRIIVIRFVKLIILNLKFIIIIFDIKKLNELIDIKIGHGLKFKIKYGWLIFIIIR